jgi:hypothetical protein
MQAAAQRHSPLIRWETRGIELRDWLAPVCPREPLIAMLPMLQIFC